LLEEARKRVAANEEGA
jgi:tetratricopeptide (TPR) repeat protein